MGNRQGVRFAKVFKCVKTQVYLFTGVEVLFPTGAKRHYALTPAVHQYHQDLCLGTDTAELTTPLNKIWVLISLFYHGVALYVFILQCKVLPQPQNLWQHLAMTGPCCFGHVQMLGCTFLWHSCVSLERQWGHEVSGWSRGLELPKNPSQTALRGRKGGTVC